VGLCGGEGFASNGYYENFLRRNGFLRGNGVLRKFFKEKCFGGERVFDGRRGFLWKIRVFERETFGGKKHHINRHFLIPEAIGLCG
jgi:hypothetical protein